jgi:RND family efflux transporter MFP subunit
MSRFGWLPLLLALVPLAGCGEEAPVPDPGPPEVQVSLPVADALTDYEVFTGRTQAVRSVDLRARVTGYLEKAEFKQGSDVKKGDVLFVIQQRSFESALKQAKGQRDQQQAQLRYNQATYDRLQRLRGSRAASQEELEQARSARDTSQAALRAAEAAVDIAQQNYDWTVIRAPFDGRISRRLVDPGNDVLADNTVLASLVQLDPLYAYFDVDERTLLRIGHLLPQGKVPSDAAYRLPVTLGLANQRPEDFTHKGVLEFADNRVDPGTGTLRLWGTFDNPSLDLRPGLFVRVRLGVGQPRRALFVAESALGSDQGRRYLYVVTAEDKVVYTPVEAGQRKGGLIAVEKGLKGGERVVVNGLQRVRPQLQVKVKQVPMPRAKARAQRPGVR